MASVNKTLGARFKIEGEEEYKSVIQQLNAGSRTLSTEMTRLQAEYKGNADSIEFLTEKGDLLGRELDQQREKTAATRQMLEAASKAYEEAAKRANEAANESEQAYTEAKAALAAADREVQKYTQQLNLAEAAEFNLQHDIDENNKALENQGNIMVKLSDSISGIADALGIQLPPGAGKALEAMKGFSNGSVAALGLATAAVAALIEGMKALHENAVQYAAEADEIITKSAVTGLSTTLLQELQYAEPLIDVSVETITGSLTKLTQNMAAAEGGNDALKEKFEALGVSITDADGQLRSAQDVFFDTVDALGQMGNDTERDAAAMALLGKSAQDLNPLIKQGTDALQEYMAAADENYVLTEDQIAALSELDDQVQKNKLEWEALKKQLAAEFAPASKDVLENFGKLVKAGGEALMNSGIIQGVGEILRMLADMMQPLTDLLDTADESTERLRPVYEILHAIALTLAAAHDALDAIAGLAPWNWGSGKLTNALGLGYGSGNANNVQRLQMSRAGTLDQYDAFYGRNAGGTDNWRGGLTWVGEAGPELVELPQGSQIRSAQESQSTDGGTTVYNINVTGIQQLEEVLTWYESRRVRARMR